MATNASSEQQAMIIVGVKENVIIDAASTLLAEESEIFQRGGQLVRVVADVSAAAKSGIRRPFSPRIEALPSATIRERLSARCDWIRVRKGESGELVKAPCRPPDWVVAGLQARPGWEGVPCLEGVVEYPVLRPDGSILSTPGYDAGTGLWLATTDVPPVPVRPTHADAVAARDRLLDAVSDFPFAAAVHKAAWLAALLTPLARFAFSGPSPLFLVDANTRGSGKGLLLDCISQILTGQRSTMAAYTDDEAELRKRITSIAISGDRLAVFDNLSGKFGNGTLDAMLTATSWKDRILGLNKIVQVPLFTVWYATGNNVAIGADTARRICHIRLESPVEKPEERGDFRRPNLLEWIAKNRGRLLADALTILRGFFVAGRPDQKLSPWGSFEGWKLVRNAVVWAGLPDPAQTRIMLQERADVTFEAMAILLRCWKHLDPDRKGVTVAELLRVLYTKNPDPDAPDWHSDMRTAIESLTGKIDSRTVAARLRAHQRRIFGGLFIDVVGSKDRAAKWGVFAAHEFHQSNLPEAGNDSADSFNSFHTSVVENELNESAESFPARAKTKKAKEVRL